MSHETTITICTPTAGRGDDGFVGSIYFSVATPWAEPDPRRRGRTFRFIHWSGEGSFTVFFDSGTCIFGVRDAHLDILASGFSARRWQEFSPTQREMMRLLGMGIRQWLHQESCATCRVVERITREEILAVQFEPIIPL